MSIKYLLILIVAHIDPQAFVFKCTVKPAAGIRHPRLAALSFTCGTIQFLPDPRVKGCDPTYPIPWE